MKSIENDRTAVFISYSHNDSAFLQRLLIHLKPLKDCNVEAWSDTRIKPGQNWRDEIERAIKSAKVAVLLISADFLASEFIANNELPPLLKAATDEGAVILPLIVSPSRFLQTKTLLSFQAINEPSKPLISMSKADQEEVLVKVSNVIESNLQHIVAKEDDKRTETKRTTENGDRFPYKFEARGQTICARIENPKQLVATDYTEDELYWRLEIVYNEYPEMFPKSEKAAFAVIWLNDKYNGVVSISSATYLIFHFIYKAPSAESENEDRWHKLLKKHIDLLNSDFRVRIYSEMRESSYRHFIRALEDHLGEIKMYIEKFCKVKSYKFEELNADLEKARNHIEFNDVSRPISESILQRLHVLIYESMRPETL